MDSEPLYSAQTSQILTQYRIKEIQQQTFCQKYLYIISAICTLVISTTIFVILNLSQECNDGFIKKGLFCYLSECGHNNCNHKGSCQFRKYDNVFYCECLPPYTGLQCNKCLPGYSSFTRLEAATAGYYTDDEFVCVKETTQCYGQRELHYENGQLSIQCTCPEGHYGDRCQYCSQGYLMHQNRCYRDLCHKSCYNGRAECTFADGVFQCICNEGHTGTSCSRCHSGYKMVRGKCVLIK